MDFFSKEVRDSFDRMFDFNHDGKLDAAEQGFQYEFMEEENKREYDDDDELDECDFDDTDFDDTNFDDDIF